MSFFCSLISPRITTITNTKMTIATIITITKMTMLPT